MHRHSQVTFRPFSPFHPIRQHHRMRPFAVSMLLIGLLGGVAACSGSSSTDDAAGTGSSQHSNTDSGNDTTEGADGLTEGSRGFTDKDGIQQEYQEYIKTLTFPDGYTPPEKLSDMSVMNADQYERGYGVSNASFIWMCAWEREWLGTYATDPQKAQHALDQLNQSDDMPFLKKADQSLRTFTRDILDKAAMGDPSGLQQDVDLNCPAQ